MRVHPGPLFVIGVENIVGFNFDLIIQSKQNLHILFEEIDINLQQTAHLLSGTLVVFMYDYRLCISDSTHLYY